MALTVEQLSELTNLANRLARFENDVQTATDMLHKSEQAAAVVRAEYAELHKKLGIPFTEQSDIKVGTPRRATKEEMRQLKSSLMQVLVSYPNQKMTVGEIITAAGISEEDYVWAKSQFTQLKNASQSSDRPIYQEGEKAKTVYWVGDKFLDSTYIDYSL